MIIRWISEVPSKIVKILAGMRRVIGIFARPPIGPCGWGYRCPFWCRTRVSGRTRSLPATHAGGASPTDGVRQYADFPLGTADASVIAVPERLSATHVATIDHRHFRAVRPAHCAAFELLPAL
jgi:hypothetical protein